MMVTRKPRTSGHSARVLEYFEERINQNVYMEKASVEIGMPVKTFKTTIHTLRSKFGAAAFTPVVAGAVWRFNGLPEGAATVDQAASGDGPDALIYTQVGITQAGVVVVKDPQNNLYTVDPM